MIHLPKKKPWLILVGIYLVIVLVWGAFFYLADEAGDQTVKPEEVDALLKNSPSATEEQPPNTRAD